ncbi:MAG: ISAs1 family transposase [Terriglobia bacterium]
METRRIWTSTDLVGYLDFPYAAQVFCIQRDTTDLVTGKSRSETVYGITSLSPERASPLRLLQLNRRHWSIENRLHWVRDWAFDEDRCRIRKHAGAHVMASLRNLAISLLRLAGAPSITAALRFCGRNRLRPLRLIGLAMD